MQFRSGLTLLMLVTALTGAVVSIVGIPIVFAVVKDLFLTAVGQWLILGGTALLVGAAIVYEKAVGGKTFFNY